MPFHIWMCMERSIENNKKNTEKLVLYIMFILYIWPVPRYLVYDTSILFLFLFCFFFFFFAFLFFLFLFSFALSVCCNQICMSLYLCFSYSFAHMIFAVAFMIGTVCMHVDWSKKTTKKHIYKLYVYHR